jgi:septal ring factor EnvC (AmiA/AmiB activator)
VNTPRTDNSAFIVPAGAIISPVVPWPVVHADFARQLETELATLTASHERMVEALDKARNGLKWYRDNYHDAESQADDEMEQEVETALALARNLNQAAK